MHKIPLLVFLIAFVAITSNFVIVDSTEQIEKGFDYNRELLSVNPDGSETYKWTSHHERVLHNGIYQDYIFSDSWLFNTMTVETTFGTVSLDKSSCVFNFYNKGSIDWFETPLFSDSIIAKMANNGTESWNNIDSINNASCEPYWTGSELVAKKFVTGVGLLEYKYILDKGNWKTQLEATNLSSATNKKFGFTQTINLNRDTINFGGSQKNLDDYHNQILSRTWLVNNAAKVLDFLNGVNFDFDKGFDNLNSISIYDDGANKSKLQFDFIFNATVIMPNQKLIIDPSYSSDNPTEDASIEDNDDDNLCENTGGTYLKTSGASTLELMTLSTAHTRDCVRAFFEWNTSTIPDGSTIQDVHFKFHITSVTSARTCDIVGLNLKPSVSTDANIFNAIGTGTVYVNNDAACQSSTTNIDKDLGSTADADLQSLLTSDYFAIGMKQDSETLDGTAHLSYVGAEEGSSTPDPTLEVTYTSTPAPNAVDTLTAFALDMTSIFLDWDEPNLNGETLIGYQINGSTSCPPLTVLVNNTGTSTSEYTAGGLTNGTLYCFAVSAWTLGGTNFTGANIANATTPNAFAPDAIIDLIASTLNFTSIYLEWTEPNLNNETLTGYFIKYGTSSPPTSTLVSNTGSSNTNYTVTTLTPDTLFYFTVSAITAGGTNFTGANIASNSTGDPAQPVKDWMSLITDDLNMDDAFGLDMGIAALVVLFGVALATKNIVYGSVLFGVIIGFAVFFGLVAIPAVILSTIVFFIILIIFSARKPSLD